VHFNGTKRTIGLTKKKMDTQKELNKEPKALHLRNKTSKEQKHLHDLLMFTIELKLYGFLQVVNISRNIDF
jgi:hypothetical protein